MAYTNSDNLFGITQYIVDPVAKYGSFQTVQSAIDAAYAAGGGYVAVRKGNYIENLTFRAGVQIGGVGVDGRLTDGVVIVGNHTFSDTGGTVGYFLAENIHFIASPGGTCITLSPVPVGQLCVLALKFCGVFSDTGKSIVCGTSTGDCVIRAVQCQINADLEALDIPTNSDVACENCSIISNTQSCVKIGASSVELRECQLDATNLNGCIQFNNVASMVNCYNVTLRSNGETVIFTTSGTGSFYHCTHSALAGSGDYVAGAAGNYYFSDDSLINNFGIAAGITQHPQQWKPYASTSSVGVAKFNPGNFAVNSSSGEVSLSSPALSWSELFISSSPPLNSGSFTTNAITATLPVGAGIGTGEAFVVCDAGPLIIKSTAPQAIVLGNQTSIAGGTLTSTSVGDTVELRYRTADGFWHAVSSIGNWIVT